ncbi:hypothetical protein EKH77_02845 [Streptomyces luteoverticillatus]|uniref:Uncharacterized protein n=1 Tax=Streptomyces luteoverticillatus TaxID=66425 RepID=A0A3Q9FSP1_STRLT|nr:hypothetical protein [Streptomyces luteoverticillatus]AZQ70294.1 hypothetical protein EKH77_02845 [Streptomyces luteoverticillatus]
MITVAFQEEADYSAQSFRRMFGSMQDFVAGFDSRESFEPSLSALHGPGYIALAPGRAWIKDGDEAGGVYWVESDTALQVPVPTSVQSGYVVLYVEDIAHGDWRNALVPQVVPDDAPPATDEGRRLVVAKFGRYPDGTLNLPPDYDQRYAYGWGQYLVTRTGPARGEDPAPAELARFRLGTQYTNFSSGNRFVRTEEGWHRDGNKFYAATVDPAKAEGLNGDQWINTATMGLFNKAGGDWAFLGSLKGAKGETGTVEANTGATVGGDLVVKQNITTERFKVTPAGVVTLGPCAAAPDRPQDGAVLYAKDGALWVAESGSTGKTFKVGSADLVMAGEGPPPGFTAVPATTGSGGNG